MLIKLAEQWISSRWARRKSTMGSMSRITQMLELETSKRRCTANVAAVCLVAIMIIDIMTASNMMMMMMMIIIMLINSMVIVRESILTNMKRILNVAKLLTQTNMIVKRNPRKKTMLCIAVTIQICTPKIRTNHPVVLPLAPLLYAQKMNGFLTTTLSILVATMNFPHHIHGMYHTQRPHMMSQYVPSKDDSLYALF